MTAAVEEIELAHGTANGHSNGHANAGKGSQVESYSAFEVALISRLTAIETLQGSILTKIDGVITAVSQHDKEFGEVRARCTALESSLKLVDTLRKEVTQLRDDENRVKGSASYRMWRDRIIFIVLGALALIHAPEMLKLLHIP